CLPRSRLLKQDPTAPGTDPFPETFYIHDNQMTGTSTEASKGGNLGGIIIIGLGELPGKPTVVPDMVWDGIVNPDKAVNKDVPVQLKPEFNICIKNNGDADWVDLNLPPGDPLKASTDLAPFDCTHPAVPPV